MAAFPSFRPRAARELGELLLRAMSPPSRLFFVAAAPLRARLRSSLPPRRLALSRSVAPPPFRRSAPSLVASVTSAAKDTPSPHIQPPPQPLSLPTNHSNPHLFRLRHTAAHVLAMAVQRLFPRAQVTIGPCIQNGFYYDFDHSQPFTDRDLKRIKKEMDKIIRQNLPLRREQISRDDARTRIETIQEPYKLQILNDISDPITVYHIGDKWWDLCAGPHVERTGNLNPKAVALETVAGAYWRGDEKNAMLQRIYGTAWETPDQLQEYLRLKEEAKRRDHRVLGAKLGLFTIQEAAGGGLVFWHPKGSRIRTIIEHFWKKRHVDNGYELLYTPHVANVDLWKTSGHFDFYQESMFDQMDVEHEQYQLKPMNCPFHCLVFKDGLRSYRELPLRWAELGTVYRYERSGTLHGLMRVRGFTQDDAHIFCLPDQLADEIRRVLDLTESILGRFGFTQYEIMLSTRPEKSVGSDDIWDKATEALKEALETKGWQYSIDEGGGAFYGPKIDVNIKDAIGRLWQCSTVQCDFNLPQRFELEYVDRDGERKRPIMVHRAIFGSVERFFGILVESYAGEFPLWLAPVQLKLLPVTDEARRYCEEVALRAKDTGLRVEVDASGERLGKMVRNGEQERVPLLAIVGEKETGSGTLSIRSRQDGDLGVVSVDRTLEAIRIAAERGTAFEAVDVVASEV
ncbi:Threonine--tRNA ligase, chloroplastic/mitochondrial 2 [Gracilariopsis chorda]|uniref:threonine--tRNA ligase n=1 Tax=Gracilariopsis chorda TaxID=448386 RepID=A0A2V3J6E4_9FLOR|nr:Threonine--tRNA ligase, chloroplastic/mitochondrial 2 [Gracilariopsis chorda]|eukprot:PXF48950.1 Threonine--tRNA ligase, chloroplastic/mitochondrial 2 [Gracilariopsis chorda]